MRRVIWPTGGILILFTGLLIVHAAHFLPFLSDDSLISLRYAQRLLGGFGLTWTAGPPVEGYSNLLWVLLVAAIGSLGVDLIVAARLLGTLGMALALGSIALWYSTRPVARAGWFPMSAALLFLAAGGPIAVWAIGGLEQPLVAGLLGCATPLMFAVIDRNQAEFRRTRWLSLVLGLLCLTRPDGPLFAAVAAVSLVAAGWAWRQPRPLAHALLALLFPALFTVGQLAFRMAYYGEVVPNTALVKIAGTATHRTFGFEYLSSGFWALAPYSLMAVALLGLLLLVPESRRRALWLAGVAGAWSGYVVFIGGDVFPAYRHLVPLMVILAFALAEGLTLLTRWLRPRPLLFYPVLAAVFAACVPYLQAQSTDKWIQRATTERWEWQGRDFALMLKAAFSTEQPLLAVTAAGTLPYWSELPAVDMMGLNDHYLPRHRPADFGSGMVGHELGDGQYVLDRRPDLIVFDVGSPQPSWRTGDELNRLPEFHRRFIPVVARPRDDAPTGVMFVDRYSPRIGVTSTESTVTIPGFLLTGDGTLAVPGDGGRLVARIPPGAMAQLTIDVGGTSDWTIDAEASVMSGADSRVGLSGETGQAAQTARAVTVTVAAKGSGAIVGRVGLKRASR